MTDWATYTLSDFLLFSPRTYYRLFELYNRALWPAQILSIALGLALPYFLFRGGARRGRLVALILALAWLWVAWAFHLERYATINWAAIYFAAAFVLEALLLVWVGVVRDRFQPAGDGLSRAGLAIFFLALVAYPLIGPLLGRPWTQMEVFGFAPDPTALATLGLLLVAAPRGPRILLLIPMLWCLASGATLWVMKAPEAPVPPLAALLVLGLALGRLHRGET